MSLTPFLSMWVHVTPLTALNSQHANCQQVVANALYRTYKDTMRKKKLVKDELRLSVSMGEGPLGVELSDDSEISDED
jgi:hypothetical protein